MTGTLCLLAITLLAGEPGKPFEIEVVDEATGRGVPLVELRTTSNTVHITDSAGVIAFDEPGLMNQKVWFEVSSHGYEFPADGFGLRGKALDISPGGKATLKLHRKNIAQRLYRITGLGIYRDSQLIGREVSIQEPLLNAQVTGSDSVMMTAYQGKLHWFWGDTNRPSYPLGNFHVPGATSPLPASSGTDPLRGINLSYFTGSDGFAKSTAKMAGDGPTWIDGLTTLPDADGREKLFAAYVKIKPPLTIYRRGICQWNDDRNEFEHVKEFPVEAPLFPFGHSFVHEVDKQKYVYFGDPFPVARIAATGDHYADLSAYEAFTCLKPQGRLDQPVIDRDAAGKVLWDWKRDTSPVDAASESKLIAKGLLKPEEARFQLRDVATKKSVMAHRGTVNWNEHRQRWICVCTEIGGTSMLGEVWYAEAPAPTGPWGTAVKIVTHEKYSFYNPVHHHLFDQQQGRTIFFEGTYTNSFSGNPHQTPRYDYNQVMYQLDLDDPRLAVLRK